MVEGNFFVVRQLRFVEAFQELIRKQRLSGLFFVFFVRDAQYFAVEVDPAQINIAFGGYDVHLSAVHSDDGNVERSAAQIVNEDVPVYRGNATVVKRRGSRFVDDPEHVQSGNRSRVHRGLALYFVKRCGNGDDDVFDFSLIRAIVF